MAVGKQLNYGWIYKLEQLSRNYQIIVQLLVDLKKALKMNEYHEWLTCFFGNEISHYEKCWFNLSQYKI